MEPGDRGDCEDFALTKMDQLYQAGIPIKNLQIGAGYTETGGAHGVLIIQTANKGTLVLDNRYDEVKPFASLPYSWIGYQRAGQSWAFYTVKLQSVPIEYMSCNAAAFADGDEVIVKFDDQDFSKPKVVGFKESPSGCISKILWTSGSYNEVYDRRVAAIFDPGDNSWTQIANYPSPARAEGAVAGSYQKAFFMGGEDETYSLPPYNETFQYNTNQEYNLLTEAWTDKTVIPSKKANEGVFSFNDFIHCFGGYDDDVIFSNSNFRYAVDSDSWTSKTSLPLALGFMGHFVLSSKGYILGGKESWENTDFMHNKTREYDPIGDAFSLKADLPATNWAFMSSFEDFSLNNGYLCGGYSRPAFDAYSHETTMGTWSVYETERLYKFDPVADTWTRKTDLNTLAYKATYYGDPIFDWVVNPYDFEEKPGRGPVRTPAVGGFVEGLQLQIPLAITPYYWIIPNQKYNFLSDTWTQIGMLNPSYAPIYAGEYSQAGAIR